MKNVHVTWENIANDCTWVATALQKLMYRREDAPEHQFQLVVPIAMGGLIPGTLIARALEHMGFKCMISVTRYRKYYEDGTPTTSGLEHPHKFFPSQYELQFISNVIVVDDVCETGETLMAARREVGAMLAAWGLDQKIRILGATLWADKGSAVRPDVTAHVKDPGHWVLFPWEVKNEL